MSVRLPATGPKSDVPARAAETAAPAGDVDRTSTTVTLDDLVRTHLPGLIRYATVLVGDQHTAADLVQEVLLRAHQRWDRITLTERPDLYLRRMVTNEHLSWRRRWHVRMVRPTADDALVDHAGTGGDHAESLARQDAIWHRLTLLPPRQRTVLVLRYYEGLADVEIATVLGTSPATVRSHAARALTTLRHTETTPMEAP
ncbi:RNA polymerase sigma factor [Promicromonospora sukumoe]